MRRSLATHFDSGGNRWFSSSILFLVTTTALVSNIMKLSLHRHNKSLILPTFHFSFRFFCKDNCAVVNSIVNKSFSIIEAELLVGKSATELKFKTPVFFSRSSTYVPVNKWWSDSKFKEAVVTYESNGLVKFARAMLVKAEKMTDGAVKEALTDFAGMLLAMAQRYME